MAEGAVSSESVYKTLTLASGQESGASGESVQEVGGSEIPPGRVSSTVTPLPLLHAQHIPHVGSLWGLIFFLCPEVWLLVVPMPVCPGPLWQASGARFQQHTKSVFRIQALTVCSDEGPIRNTGNRPGRQEYCFNLNVSVGIKVRQTSDILPLRQALLARGV